MVKDSLVDHETRESKIFARDPDMDPWSRSYVFTCFIECGQCAETLAVSGAGSVELFDSIDEHGERDTFFGKYFTPVMFSKPMPLFKVKPEFPSVIRSYIESVFSLTFCDPSAAANYIRKCAEQILVERGVPTRTTNGGYLSLDSRIAEYRKIDEKNAGRISALRWIGNAGSHEVTISRRDVFDGLDVLEVVLEEIYVQHIRGIDDIVQKINNVRGPRV